MVGGLEACYSGHVTLMPYLGVHFLSFPQPRDVTNFTVGGFAPMSPRISSPMHPSAAGESGSDTNGVSGDEVGLRLERSLSSS